MITVSIRSILQYLNAVRNQKMLAYQYTGQDTARIKTFMKRSFSKHCLQNAAVEFKKQQEKMKHYFQCEFSLALIRRK